MPCANYTLMGSTINLVLTLNHFTYRFMNELVGPKSKRQPIISLFILQFNFNKLKALLLQAFISATKPFGESTYLGKYSHLPKVASGSPSLGVHYCYN